MIGLAEVNYTPPVGLDLVGNYRGIDYASRGVHDSLFARAMVVENEEKVTFKFKPQSFKNGSIISSIAVLFIIIYFIFVHIKTHGDKNKA